MPETLFTLLDAARLGDDLVQAQLINADHACLYTGRSALVLASHAPYLFSFDPTHSFSNWLFTNGWGKAWGVFGRSVVGRDELYRHFRRFLMVELEGSEPIYFRFYDPRVLRRFLPTCTPQQLADFFGPVEYFWLEDEDPAYGLYIWLDGGQLVTHRVSRDELEQTFNQTSASHVPNQ